MPTDGTGSAASGRLWTPEQHDQRCPARQGGECVHEPGCKPSSAATRGLTGASSTRRVLVGKLEETYHHDLKFGHHWLNHWLRDITPWLREQKGQRVRVTFEVLR